jgi:hypothetical protein
LEGLTVCLNLNYLCKKSVMTIPNANYVIDSRGKKVFVQLSVQDWERFVTEFKRIECLVSFKDSLKNAFREVREIQKGKKKGIPLNDFLDGL